MLSRATARYVFGTARRGGEKPVGQAGGWTLEGMECRHGDPDSRTGTRQLLASLKSPTRLRLASCITIILPLLYKRYQ